MKRVAEFRKWTWDVVKYDDYLLGRFRFALLPKVPEPKQFLYGNHWYNLADSQPVALLEG